MESRMLEVRTRLRSESCILVIKDYSTHVGVTVDQARSVLEEDAEKRSVVCHLQGEDATRQEDFLLFEEMRART